MLKAIHRMQRDERGFTLVELLIVIAIIAILAAIAIPQFASYRANANKKAAIGTAKTCLTILAGEAANGTADPSAATYCPTGCSGNLISATCNSPSDPNIKGKCDVGTTGEVTCTNPTS